MSSYLLIESRDPFEWRAVHTYELAMHLRAEGNEVALFLVQDAVQAARSRCSQTGLEKIMDTGVEVLADDFSLRERGIAADALASGARSTSIDLVVERMVAGWKTIWH